MSNYVCLWFDNFLIMICCKKLRQGGWDCLSKRNFRTMIWTPLWEWYHQRFVYKALLILWQWCDWIHLITVRIKCMVKGGFLGTLLFFVKKSPRTGFLVVYFVTYHNYPPKHLHLVCIQYTYGKYKCIFIQFV